MEVRLWEVSWICRNKVQTESINIVCSLAGKVVEGGRPRAAPARLAGSFPAPAAAGTETCYVVANKDLSLARYLWPRNLLARR